MITGTLCIAAVCFWIFQIVKGSHYVELAESNKHREGRIAAPRGKIFDRRGMEGAEPEAIIVDNRTAFSLYLIPERCENIDGALEEVKELVGLDKQELSRIGERRVRLRAFQPLLVKEEISFEEMAYIESRAERYPWIEIGVYQKRNYPHLKSAAHLLGHVGEVTESQLETEDFTGVQPGSLVGQTGLELQYQEELKGHDGNFKLLVDSVGRVVREVSRNYPTPGFDLVLTIDLRLQQKAEELFEDKEGCLVAMDVRTGEILALVSSPAYNPSQYIKMFPTLIADEESPLINRVISSKFSPGSVWKVLMAIAALQEGIIDRNTTLFCGGVALLENRYFHCNSAGGHGDMTLVPALTRSCNIYFYKVGRLLGIEKIAKWAKRFGFGRITGVDLPYEVEGLVPTPEWKRRTKGVDWYPGETINVSIGQGSLEVTPLQMVRFMAAVANGGWLVHPHLIRGVRDTGGRLRILSIPEPQKVGVDEEILKLVRAGIYGAVNVPGGTALAASNLGGRFKAAGKTGTAQVVKKRLGVSPEEMEKEQRHHSWFVCFAPFEEPEIAVCVFVEHGGSASRIAVPLAAEFLRTYRTLREEIMGELAKRTAE